jgi:hypothetical protein
MKGIRCNEHVGVEQRKKNTVEDGSKDKRHMSAQIGSLSNDNIRISSIGYFSRECQTVAFTRNAACAWPGKSNGRDDVSTRDRNERTNLKNGTMLKDWGDPGWCHRKWRRPMSLPITSRHQRLDESVGKT